MTRDIRGNSVVGDGGDDNGGAREGELANLR
jgi:hypothetical protein